MLLCYIDTIKHESVGKYHNISTCNRNIIENNYIFLM